jgi:hypothetical protein
MVMALIRISVGVVSSVSSMLNPSFCTAWQKLQFYYQSGDVGPPKVWLPAVLPRLKNPAGC